MDHWVYTSVRRASFFGSAGTVLRAAYYNRDRDNYSRLWLLFHGSTSNTTTPVEDVRKIVDF
jgi:hypothetical protein